ncbi:MAG TPA: co-chaperone DjlA [Nevskiaceae bacterium]|nr:co-chaperone DjlA [Nevskiaceae bacterium]
MNFAVLIGGVVGLLASGSFIGLIIGAIGGFFVSKLLKRGAISTAKHMRSPFIDSTFAVMGAACKADGRVSEEEIRVAEGFFDRFHLGAEAREAAKHAFNRGKQPGFDLDAELARFQQISHGQRVLHLIFLQVQFAAMTADGQINTAEHAMLLRIARGLGLSEYEIQRLEAMLNGMGGGGWGAGTTWDAGSASGRSTPQRDLDSAYAVIGVDASDSDDTIKRAYRKLMSENHPDKLAAKGLPESMREMAERKTQEITAAYRTIEEARAAARA